MGLSEGQLTILAGLCWAELHPLSRREVQQDIPTTTAEEMIDE
jgi:hypothetical protein